MSFLGGFMLGAIAGAVAVVWRLSMVANRLDAPVRMPKREGRCVPKTERASGHTLVYGARETYSHPQADAVLTSGVIWTPGGSA